LCFWQNGTAEERQRHKNQWSYWFYPNQSVHDYSFPVPADVDSAIAGPEETKNQRGEALRLIQIR
jgi:hypothetical protein